MYSLKKKNNFYDDWMNDFDDLFAVPFFGRNGLTERLVSSPALPVNIKEVEKGYEVEVSLPGYDKADIKAEMLDANHLRVEVNRNKEDIDEKEHREFYRHEHLSRLITLSKEVDASNIKAEYKDGILKLELPADTKAIESKKILIG